MGPRSERSGRRRVAGLRCTLLAAALALSPGCERAEPAAPRGDGDALAARRAAAARRGAEWLIGHRDAMGPDWAFAMLSYLCPILRDPELAQRCRAGLDDASRAPIVALPAELGDPELLRPARLRLIAAELLRRRRTGEAWEEPAAALEELLRRHGDEFWSRTRPLQQLTFLHSFSELGIESQRSLDDVVRELRARWAQGDPDALLEDALFMFAITHVFYTASGYLTRRPDPADFAPEIELLHRALRRYLAAPLPPDRHFLDLQAELLVALRLLRVPEDDAMRAMDERLLALQNADGSWGEASDNHREHATLVAVQALTELPDRPGRR